MQMLTKVDTQIVLIIQHLVIGIKQHSKVAFLGLLPPFNNQEMSFK